jgi:hypothetical protein
LLVSGGLHEPRVHFEAPPSYRVSDEMSCYTDWLNRTASIVVSKFGSLGNIPMIDLLSAISRLGLMVAAL